MSKATWLLLVFEPGAVSMEQADGIALALSKQHDIKTIEFDEFDPTTGEPVVDIDLFDAGDEADDTGGGDHGSEEISAGATSDQTKHKDAAPSSE